ncbi:Chitinase [Spodoptera exigua multiple nucleopolyhedrovirus]|uniref:Chitinase n=1 Tax=Spodoptera exigua multiple nucleopolyhedrovirus TaxID=10454 RepID=W0UW86_9ABAC|nr:chitinase [Spodoptera exigua multiple nucleopolyhedrovirus]UWK31542.1 chitinase [Spodoptera exigua multiple nucleopolyhedrovirus]CDG72362.1 Chitinase [Spodoptera exigua multiple nucleopolyhedrovirus]CDG72499.1 Chitinase [Spodoptera exigua multiple nucleopolyhedrovirus]CDG72636.1 Chitinase [Spodoptera exigua multiple nucleopolyhedrovirus]
MPYIITLFLACVVLSTKADVPGVPTIDWSDRNYALVKIDHEATSYEKLIKITSNVEVPVSWNVWTGDVGDVAYVLFDGKQMYKGDATVKKAIVLVDKGGNFDMTVKLCNVDGCSTSSAVKVVVADTDGSHLAPLTYDYFENNKRFEIHPDKIVAAYFVEWGVYLRQFPVDKVPAPNLSHILYGFVPICGGDGINDALKTVPGSFEALQRSCAGRADFKVAIHDPWAAIQKPQKGVSSWNEPYKGNFGQLMAMKRANPHIKVFASIGGWTLSDPFYHMHDADVRRVFIDSVEEFLLTWKFFDGVDIDWEFPGGKGANPDVGDAERDRETYTLLLQELRLRLNALGARTNRYYALTSAVSAGNDKIAVVNYTEAQKYLDTIFLMTYDFKGAWSNTELGHQTALFAPTWRPDEPYCADRAVELLLGQHVPAGKIALGVAMYGRGWSGVVSDDTDNPFLGVADGPVPGTWEAGVVDYRQIVHNMSQYDYVYDEVVKGAYVYNRENGNLITYDDPKSVADKTKYVLDHELAGVFAWEIDADNGDLLNAINKGLGGKQADYLYTSTLSSTLTKEIKDEL